MTDEEILLEIRKNATNENTPEYMIFNMLSTAHPNVIKVIEQQAVHMKKVGAVMGREMMEAGDDPIKKAKVMATLDKIMQGFPKPAPDDDNETPTI